MNKVILMGRLTQSPEVRYTQAAEPLAVARYTLAVNKRFKRQGEADADFINCVSFGKAAEFAEKYFKKGQMVSVIGRLQVRSWDDQNGQKRWTTEVVIEEQYFAESKTSFESRAAANTNMGTAAPSPAPAKPAYQPTSNVEDGFYPIDESIEDDDDLPF
ncbi:single-stranded DNA-binding protein [Clostridium sp. MD294]|uniref:single-stranded DNA-binding protein n=1 Tax=Clostridium sp. MD294 TaxID=97138 RepID=UPI0002C9083E|nr:single-stranded DNA-binding protein [Clostridium sp. MD294]NDO47370.1 single-stranded DNA-binding protein [Clostridium sp. MD294]USF29560.1 Single-stranded DNA-binding protein [Clostridium sp. MD294]